MATHELTLSLAMTSAPASNRSFAVEESAHDAAWWRGVCPSCTSIQNIVSLWMQIWQLWMFHQRDVPPRYCQRCLFAKSWNHTMSFRFKIFKRIKIYVCRYWRKCGLTSTYPQKIIASEKPMDLRWCAFTIVDGMFITSSRSSYVIDASM